MRMRASFVVAGFLPNAYRAHGLMRLSEHLFVSVGFSHNIEEPDLCFVAFTGLFPPLSLGS